MLFFGSQVIAVILAVFSSPRKWPRWIRLTKVLIGVILPMEGNPVWSRTQEVSSWRAWMLHWQSFLDTRDAYFTHSIPWVYTCCAIYCIFYFDVKQQQQEEMCAVKLCSLSKCYNLFQRNAHALREPIHNDFIEHCLKNTGIFKLLTGKYYLKAVKFWEHLKIFVRKLLEKFKAKLPLYCFKQNISEDDKHRF